MTFLSLRLSFILSDLPIRAKTKECRNTNSEWHNSIQHSTTRTQETLLKFHLELSICLATINSCYQPINRQVTQLQYCAPSALVEWSMPYCPWQVHKSTEQVKMYSQCQFAILQATSSYRHDGMSCVLMCVSDNGEWHQCRQDCGIWLHVTSENASDSTATMYNCSVSTQCTYISLKWPVWHNVSVRSWSKRSRVQISAGPLPGNSLMQAAHKHKPLSPSSVIWYLRPWR